MGTVRPPLSFISTGAAILRILSDVERNGRQQKRVDHAAFVQRKSEDEPNRQEYCAGNPEHLGKQTPVRDSR